MEASVSNTNPLSFKWTDAASPGMLGLLLCRVCIYDTLPVLELPFPLSLLLLEHLLLYTSDCCKLVHTKLQVLHLLPQQILLLLPLQLFMLLLLQQQLGTHKVKGCPAIC